MSVKTPGTNPDLVVFTGPMPSPEPAADYDPEMTEILEAKKHFDDKTDPDDYWAGRLLADRKSTRIAA